MQGIDVCAFTSLVTFDLLTHEAAEPEPLPYILCWHVAWNQSGPLLLPVSVSRLFSPQLGLTHIQDIDKESLVSARQNVERNGLSDRIAIVDVSCSESVLQTLEGAFAVPYILIMEIMHVYVTDCTTGFTLRCAIRLFTPAWRKLLN